MSKHNDYDSDIRDMVFTEVSKGVFVLRTRPRGYKGGHRRSKGRHAA